jgi:hypothetical protein
MVKETLRQLTVVFWAGISMAHVPDDFAERICFVDAAGDFLHQVLFFGV